MPTFELACTRRSELGGRRNNEDAAFASSRLVVVADGVGGAVAGEVASQVVVDALVALDKRWVDEPLDLALAEAVEHGNDALRLVTAHEPATTGMSTTVTAVALADDGRFVVAHVGDSRAYLLRHGRLLQLTVDETLVQALIDQGVIDERDRQRHPQRSVLIRAMDGAPGCRPVMDALRARCGDRLLVCSDGLSDVLTDEAIREHLREPDRDQCAAALVQAALDNGARDNVTLVVADVLSPTVAAGWRRPW